MTSRNIRKSSDTSEDLDDPPPLSEDNVWYSHHHKNDSGLRLSQDLPEGPGFMSDDESEEEDEENELPNATSPVARSRALSSQSEASETSGPPAFISSRGLGSVSDDSEGSPAKITARSFSSQSDEIENEHFSFPSQVKHRGLKSVNDGASQIWKNSFNALGEKRKRGFSVVSNSTSADSGDTDQDDDAPVAKKQAPALRMMAGMGWQEGRGLGKHEQGRIAPVEESKQKGTRGLGFAIPALGTPGLKYDPSLEFVNVKEEVNWLKGPDQGPPTKEEMKSWIQIGQRKHTIDDENLFCNEVVLENVIKSKSVFDALDGKELMKARSRANPFELIKGVFFQNRAAMKMANMDAVFNFMFTNPRDRFTNSELLGPNDLLYFADVCAGPGGFSEYVLYRRKWRAKGIGFTLKGPNDFKLENFYAAPSESFEPFYGTRDDGDVYVPENIDSLHRHVLHRTEGMGVHFMMADGGFSVEGQENIQEILSKRLYLCQCLVALRIVRTDGHFVVKLFDVFTPFSVGLIYLMYRCFSRVTIHKPNTSRPANSERYLICEFKRENCDDVANYMMQVNKKLASLENSGKDVNSIVPIEILTEEDKDFFDYIKDSNNLLGQRQVVQLLKIAAFCEDPHMIELRQHELRSKCLKLYDIPDKTRIISQDSSPALLANELLGKPIEKVKWEQAKVPSRNDKILGGELRDWMCCVLGSQEDDVVPQPTLFVGLGGSKVFRLEDRTHWAPVPNIELPRRTLLIGELVFELEGGRGNQKKVKMLHIIDAAWLGEEDLRSKQLSDRLELCETFAKAIRGDALRAKRMFDLYDFEILYKSLERREKKNGEKCLAMLDIENPNKFFIPGGVFFLRRTKKPWVRVYSKTHQQEYFYHTLNNRSEFEVPEDSWATFDVTFDNLKVWWWSEGVKMRPDQGFPIDPQKLQPDAILREISIKIRQERGGASSRQV